MLEILIIYMIGVFVARMQLHYWTREILLEREEYEKLDIFSLWSWAIYPICLFNYVKELLNNR